MTEVSITEVNTTEATNQRKKILVPIDFSDQSVSALQRADLLAEIFHADVHLLHLTDPVRHFAMDMVSAPVLDDAGGIDGIADLAQEAHAFNQLKALADNCDCTTHLHLETSEGSHARDICAFAKALHADLIVMGRHDEKNVLKHLFVGVTVKRVVAHANCSVLVIMPQDLFAKDAI